MPTLARAAWLLAGMACLPVRPMLKYSKETQLRWQENFPMGIIRTELQLVNQEDLVSSLRGNLPPEEVRHVTVPAVVDTGATRMVINEETFEKLGLLQIGTVESRIADGSYRILPLSEGVWINFQNRSTVQRAIVAPRGSTVLLGAIPLQDLDVVINMQKECIEVNPESPDIQSCLLL